MKLNIPPQLSAGIDTVAPSQAKSIEIPSDCYSGTQ